MIPLLIIGAGLVALGGWWALGELTHREEKQLVLERIYREVPRGAKGLNVGCAYYTFGEGYYRMVNTDVRPRDVPNFRLADVRRLPFPDRSFDFVFCSHVLEHLPPEDVPKALKELYRVCRDPSKVYLVLPHPCFPQTWLDLDHQSVFIDGEALPSPAKLVEDLVEREF